MSEQKITEIAKVLETWNPLQGEEHSIDSLEGYKYEAMDILSSYKLMSGTNKVATATKQVIEQAFGISLRKKEVEQAAIQIANIINK
ncbi:MAG: hypothetical protein R8M46_01990 [Ghiorsea sp.]